MNIARLIVRHADLAGTAAWLTVLAYWLSKDGPWWVWVAFVLIAAFAVTKDVASYFVENNK